MFEILLWLSIKSSDQLEIMLLASKSHQHQMQNMQKMSFRHFPSYGEGFCKKCPSFIKSATLAVTVSMKRAIATGQTSQQHTTAHTWSLQQSP
jgi:hypothetical protein